MCTVFVLDLSSWSLVGIKRGHVQFDVVCLRICLSCLFPSIAQSFPPYQDAGITVKA